MHAEDLLATLDVGQRDRHLPVETARAQQCGIEHVGAIGRSDDDDAFVRLEPVHFDEQLVERLLALVIAIAEPRTAMAPDRVDFVDKDDARRALLRFDEHIANTARADADEHLDEIGARNREERHARLTSDGAREQRLAGAGRTDEQRTLRDLAAQS